MKEEEKVKSWKKRTEKLSNDMERWRKKTHKFLESSRKLSPSNKGGDDLRNPGEFERRVLTGIEGLGRGIEEILYRFDAFEWASKKRWWMAVVLSIIASIIGSAMLS